MNNTYKYILKNGITGSLKIVITSIVTLVILPFLVSKIGLINYGLLALTYTFSGLTGMFDLGLSKSLVFLINKTEKEQKTVNNYISTCVIINISIVILIILFSIIALNFKFNIFGNVLNMGNEYFNKIIFISIILLALNLYNTLQASILESFLLLHYVNIGFIINILSINLLYFINLITINNFSLLLFSPLISYCISSLYYLIIINIKIKYKLVIPNKSYIKIVLNTTFSFFKISLFSSLHLPMNRLLLTYNTASPQLIAIFDISLKLVLFVNNLLSNLSNPLLGIVSRNKIEGKKAINYVILFSFVLVFCFYIGYMILSNNIIDFFYKTNENYTNQINIVLSLLLLSLGMVGIFEPINKYYMGIGNFSKLFKIRILIIVINLISFIFFRMFNTNILNNIVYSYSISLILFSLLLIHSYFLPNFNKILKRG